MVCFCVISNFSWENGPICHSNILVLIPSSLVPIISVTIWVPRSLFSAPPVMRNITQVTNIWSTSQRYCTWFISESILTFLYFHTFKMVGVEMGTVPMQLLDLQETSWPTFLAAVHPAPSNPQAFYISKPCMTSICKKDEACISEFTTLRLPVLVHYIWPE